MDVCNKIDTTIVAANAVAIRRRIIELAFKAGKNGAHTGGCLSLVEILSTLYFFKKDTVTISDNRNRVILSKGHGALALYCTLERYGFLSCKQTDTFETNGTHYFAHASRNINEGIEFSGGSLSLGISFAVGVALACKSKELNNHIYVIVGDGECNEGLLWEAVMSMANYQLDNVTVIVDCNRLQSDGFTNEVMDTGSLASKFHAFGFATYEVDGHSIDQLTEAFAAANMGKPKAIIANTIKGKGVTFMENQAAWHHGVVNKELFDRAITELNKI